LDDNRCCRFPYSFHPWLRVRSHPLPTFPLLRLDLVASVYTLCSDPDIGRAADAFIDRAADAATGHRERVVAHGAGQRPASGGQERRTTSPVGTSVRPVAPPVHPVHWHVPSSLCRRRRGARRPSAASVRGHRPLSTVLGVALRAPSSARLRFGFRVAEPGFGISGTTVMVVPARGGPAAVTIGPSRLVPAC
jgi:hypothetical protein